MNFEIIINNVATAESNMKKDIHLLSSLEENQRCILHLYAWEGNCATYGYFIDPFEFLNKDGVRKRKLQIARRPTGGGIIFHHCDLAFSVFVPASHQGYSLNTMDNYALVNSAVIEAVKGFTGGSSAPGLLIDDSASLDVRISQFCMAKPTKYDVMINGLKVGGGAQRRTKFGLLHQGSISLSIPTDDFLQEVLIEYKPAAMAMRRYGHKLLGENPSPLALDEGRREMQFQLFKALQKRLL